MNEVNSKIDQLEADLLKSAEKILGGLDDFIDNLNKVNKAWEQALQQLKERGDLQKSGTPPSPINHNQN